jgi:hypothetical protein
MVFWRKDSQMATPLLSIGELSELADRQDHNSAHDSAADIRWWKISDAKHRLATGHYERDQVLDAAMNRLLNELRGQAG